MGTPLIDRLSLALFSAQGDERAATQAARRWKAARDAEPELAGDLIRLGGVLSMQVQTLEDGQARLGETDPARLAYEAGRRDMALQLLGLMNLSNFELSRLMETNDVSEA